MKSSFPLLRPCLFVAFAFSSIGLASLSAGNGRVLAIDTDEHND